MFLKIHEPASSNEHFNWFDEKGILIDSEDSAIKLHLSTINRYIIEIDKNNPNKVPEFVKWLHTNDYKIYCVYDCRREVLDMTNIQRILFEREMENWHSFENKEYIYIKQCYNLGNIKFVWNSYYIFSKNNIDLSAFSHLFEELNIFSSQFPNLTFPKFLGKHNDIIIGKIIWGESFFRPGIFEEPFVLICYTNMKLTSDVERGK